MKNEFSTLDIVRGLNIPRERLRDWMNRGFVRPTQEAQGQGTKAVFTRFDICLVALFRNLVEMGFNRKLAGFCVEATINQAESNPDIEYLLIKSDGKSFTMKALSDDPDERWVLELGGGRVGTYDSEGIDFLSQDQATWQSFHIINFKQIRADVDLKMG
jgi:hypothetical protein